MFGFINGGRIVRFWSLTLFLSAAFLVCMNYQVQANTLLVVGRVVTSEGVGLEGADVTVEFTRNQTSIQTTSQAEGLFIVTFNAHGSLKLSTGFEKC